MTESGFFTASPHRLPHPAVPLRVILATHTALTRAFELLRSSPPAGFHLKDAKEDDITRQLHAILEDRFLTSQEIAGFDRRRIRNVIRAPEVSNHDGSHPAKKPDLVLFLLRRERWSVRNSQDGIFAECKPVDDSHAVGKHYCDQGIMRFVSGDYAWAMQEGLMVGFCTRKSYSARKPCAGARRRRSAREARLACAAGSRTAESRCTAPQYRARAQLCVDDRPAGMQDQAFFIHGTPAASREIRE